MTTPLTTMASAISFADVTSAILAIAALLAGLYVLWKGAHFVLRAIKSL